jgi:mannan endo-1,4-beta-mannosidase
MRPIDRIGAVRKDSERGASSMKHLPSGIFQKTRGGKTAAGMGARGGTRPRLRKLVSRAGIVTVALSLLELGTFALSPIASHAAVPADFVTRNGAQLTLNGQPFSFTGVNIYNANSNGNCGHAMATGPELDNDLAELGTGARVIRAWFFQDMATSAGIRDWAAFDHTLNVARQRGVRVLPTLANQWADCEPSAGYKDESWYTTGYTLPDPGGTTSYRDFVQEIVTRYRDDPVIFAWQLINEAEVKPSSGSPGCSTNAAGILHDWAADVSGLIKSIDPNHLVSLGTIGTGQCGAAGSEYSQVHNISSIDLCEYHDYGEPEAVMPGDQYNGLQVRLNQCAALSKPLFIGEAGINPNDSNVQGTTTRADLFFRKFNSEFPAGVTGELLWVYNGSNSTLDPNYDIDAGDPALAVLRGFATTVQTFGTTTYKLSTSLAVDSSANRLYATNFDFYNGSYQFSVIDADTHLLIRNQPTGGRAPRLLDDAAHGLLYESRDFGETVPGDVLVYDTGADGIVGFAGVGNAPQGIDLDSSASRLYSADYGSDSVSVVDTGSLARVGTISTGSQSRPTDVAVDPSRHLAFATLFGDGLSGGGLLTIDTSTDSIVRTNSIGRGPWSVAVDSSTDRVYAGVLNDHVIVVLQGSTGQELGRIPLLGSPVKIVVDPGSQRVYVREEGTAIIDATTLEIISEVPAVNGNGLAIDPSRHRVYASGNGVSVFTDPQPSLPPISRPTSPPTPPSGVTAAAGDGTATLSWTPPDSDGGSAISSYEVTSSPSAGTVTVGGSSTSTTMTGLTNGTTYTFTVRATNQAGKTSDSSAPSNPVTPQVDSPPPTTASGTADPATGGSVATGTDPSPSAPLATSVDVPPGTSGGEIAISQTAIDQSSSSGYSFLGQQVEITAPTATTADPLTLVFTIDASLANGQTPQSLQIFRTESGSTQGPIPACSGPGAVPDPCVSNRAYVNGTDIQITILTSHASTWNFGVVPYQFSGFFSPVSNPPTLNKIKAGAAVPLKFSLQGNKGMNIFSAGYPKVQEISCPSRDGITTLSSATGTLSYDKKAAQYTYTWMTSKRWAGTCREIRIKLNDGTTHPADFQMLK